MSNREYKPWEPGDGEYLRALRDVEDLVREFGVDDRGDEPKIMPKEVILDIINVLREVRER